MVANDLEMEEYRVARGVNNLFQGIVLVSLSLWSDGFSKKVLTIS